LIYFTDYCLNKSYAMKLLVTDATGFVGRHLVPLLLERDHQVTALARNEKNAKRFDWYSRVLFISYDILNMVYCKTGMYNRSYNFNL
jgi:nucleoside-diphosphate-sugar epimerase